MSANNVVFCSLFKFTKKGLNENIRLSCSAFLCLSLSKSLLDLKWITSLIHLYPNATVTLEQIMLETDIIF